MKRTSLAALLAAPVLLVFPGIAIANPPKQCYALGGKFCVAPLLETPPARPTFQLRPLLRLSAIRALRLRGTPTSSTTRTSATVAGGGLAVDTVMSTVRARLRRLLGRGGICTGGHGACTDRGSTAAGSPAMAAATPASFTGTSWLAPAVIRRRLRGCVPTAFNPMTTDPVIRYAVGWCGRDSAALPIRNYPRRVTRPRSARGRIRRDL